MWSGETVDAGIAKRRDDALRLARRIFREMATVDTSSVGGRRHNQMSAFGLQKTIEDNGLGYAILDPRGQHTAAEMEKQAREREVLGDRTRSVSPAQKAAIGRVPVAARRLEA